MANSNPALAILIGTLVLSQLGIGPAPDVAAPSRDIQANGQLDQAAVANSVVQLINKLKPLAAAAVKDLAGAAPASSTQPKFVARVPAVDAKQAPKTAPLPQHVHLNFSRTQRPMTPEEEARYLRMKPIYDSMIQRHEAKLAAQRDGIQLEDQDGTEQE